MKIAYPIAPIILTLLAASSGIAKLLLMQQDVEFFRKFGFSNTAIIAFGAALVALTLLVSLVLLPTLCTLVELG